MAGHELSPPPRPDACELCGRAAPLTKHHLIPKSRHHNKKNKRNFEREDVKTRLLWICRPCHSNIHAVLTEKELEYEYNEPESLANHPEVKKFSQWIAPKPPDFKPAVKTMNGRKRRR